MPPLGTDRQAEPDLAECGSRHREPDDVLRHRRDPDQVSYEQGGPLFAAIWLAEPRHIGTFAIGQHGKAAHEQARHAGPMLADAFGQLCSCHARHHQVESGVRFQDLESPWATIERSWRPRIAHAYATPPRVVERLRRIDNP
jgi:hypothetical protein